MRYADGHYVPARVCASNFMHDGMTWWSLALRPVPDDGGVVGRRARLQVLANEAALTSSHLHWDEIGQLDAVLESLGIAVGAKSIGIWVDHDADPANSVTCQERARGGPSTPSGHLDGKRFRFQPATTDSEASVEVDLSDQQRAMLRAEFVDPSRWDDANADLVMIVGSLIVATGRRCHAQRTLLTRSEEDPLTGLLNAGALVDRLTALMASEDVVVLFADLDGFKALDDRSGHRHGGEVLERVALADSTSSRPVTAALWVACLGRDGAIGRPTTADCTRAADGVARRPVLRRVTRCALSSD